MGSFSSQHEKSSRQILHHSSTTALICRKQHCEGEDDIYSALPDYSLGDKNPKTRSNDGENISDKCSSVRRFSVLSETSSTLSYASSLNSETSDSFQKRTDDLLNRSLDQEDLKSAHDLIRRVSSKDSLSKITTPNNSPTSRPKQTFTFPVSPEIYSLSKNLKLRQELQIESNLKMITLANEPSYSRKVTTGILLQRPEPSNLTPPRRLVKQTSFALPNQFLSPNTCHNLRRKSLENSAKFSLPPLQRKSSVRRMRQRASSVVAMPHSSSTDSMTGSPLTSILFNNCTLQPNVPLITVTAPEDKVSHTLRKSLAEEKKKRLRSYSAKAAETPVW